MIEHRPHHEAGVSSSGRNASEGSSAEWKLRQPFGWKTILFAMVAMVVLVYTGKTTEMDRMAVLLGEWAASVVGIKEESQVGRGAERVVKEMFPIQLREETSVGRIEDFDPDEVRWPSRIETRTETDYRLNPATFEIEEVLEEREILVQPFGYLGIVLRKMVETLEIALWGTIIAVFCSIPLAFYGARNYSRHRAVYFTSRSIVGFLRAIPELISALFLVLAFGFGPIAGILALGLHSAGFLGKFYAEDIENADRGPQEALFCLGLNRVKVLWYAVLPQVLPQYVAYTLYILDRNVRMATVIGIVGAGGIGQELKGRYEMFNYSHVGTILVVLFLTVMILDQLSARLRRCLIA